MKVMSADVVHKFDAGGVILNVRGAEEARAAYAKIYANVARRVPGAKIQGILIEQMAPKGVEVILGASRDPRFGPLMMFGLGGTLVEVLKDVSFRLAPMWQISAERMVRQIRSFQVLDGFRGNPPCDVDGIVDCLLRLSRDGLRAAGDFGVGHQPPDCPPQGKGVLCGRQQGDVAGDEVVRVIFSHFSPRPCPRKSPRTVRAFFRCGHGRARSRAGFACHGDKFDLNNPVVRAGNPSG